MDSPTLNLLFSLSLILIFHSPLPANAGSIEKACENAYPRDDCIRFFKGYKEFESAKDKKALGKLVVKMAIKKAKETQDYINDLRKTNPSPALQQCATDSYKELINGLTGGLEALSKSDNMAGYDILLACEYISTCQKEVSTPEFQNLTELHKRNDEMSNFCNMCAIPT